MPFYTDLFYLLDGHKNPPSCAKSLWMWLSSEGPSSLLTLNTFYKVPFHKVPFYKMPFCKVPLYKSFFTKCLCTKAFWMRLSSEGIFPSYFEYFLQSAFSQSAFSQSAFLHRSFLLTRWTQKSSILCKISVDVIIIRRTIFPSTPIIMCESVSVFLSCKSK